MYQVRSQQRTLLCLPVAGLTAGSWITTERGRSPWVAFARGRGPAAKDWRVVKQIRSLKESGSTETENSSRQRKGWKGECLVQGHFASNTALVTIGFYMETMVCRAEKVPLSFFVQVSSL